MFDATHESEEYVRGIEVRFIVLVAKTEISRTQMEDPKCPNRIENARIAGERGNAVPVTEPVVWHCKRAKCVPPAILMAAGSAKIAGVWAALILPGNRLLSQQPRSPKVNDLSISIDL